MIVMKHDGFMKLFANETTNGLKLEKKNEFVIQLRDDREWKKRKALQEGKTAHKSQVKGNSMFISPGL